METNNGIYNLIPEFKKYKEDLNLYKSDRAPTHPFAYRLVAKDFNNDDIDDYSDRLDELSARMDTERARYVERFTAMEASVTSFKKTGDMLDSFMETWKAGLKN